MSCLCLENVRTGSTHWTNMLNSRKDKENELIDDQTVNVTLTARHKDGSKFVQRLLKCPKKAKCKEQLKLMKPLCFKLNFPVIWSWNTKMKVFTIYSGGRIIVCVTFVSSPSNSCLNVSVLGHNGGLPDRLPFLIKIPRSWRFLSGSLLVQAKINKIKTIQIHRMVMERYHTLQQNN